MTTSGTQRLAAAAIVVATLLAYANTFAVPFVFDDIGAVTQNPSIGQFSTALRPPAGLSVTGRPLVNLSFALNHAISGRAVWSYHALNLALHLACALALFALVRRTLARGALPAAAAPGAIAFVAALGWAVHPLHAAAVTYVMQRTELLAGACCLLTLLGFVHGIEADERGDSLARRRWFVGAVAASALGMAAKEVTVVAPLLVLLYDRTFVAGSLRVALRNRGGFYLALAATWLVLAALVLGTDNRGGSAGLDAGMPWTDYAQTQLFAVAHYLRLALWPTPLVFDYGATIVRAPSVLILGGAVTIGIVAATALLLRRRPALAFAGAWFLLWLAPSSSVVPIATQTIAEHRVYLALAAPIAVAAAGIFQVLGRRARPLAIGAAGALALLCAARNTTFRSVLRLWRDTAEKQPANARAHYNYALALSAAGDEPGARAEFTRSLALDPRHALARHKLGALLVQAGRPAEALPHLEAALALRSSASLHYDAATALLLLRRPADAMAQLRAGLALDPSHAPSHYNLGRALAELGRYTEALSEFDAAARLDPADASARRNADRLREYLGR